MTDKEIHALRSKCRSLEKQTRELEASKCHLEKKLLTLSTNSCLSSSVAGSGSLVDHDNKNRQVGIGSKRYNDLINLERHYIDKFQNAARLLRQKLQWELNAALRSQREQLKFNFRSDLYVLTQRNQQLFRALQLQQLRAVHEDTEINYKPRQRKTRQLMTSEQELLSLEKLRRDFEKQIYKLLNELKGRERTIEYLQQKCVHYNVSIKSKHDVDTTDEDDMSSSSSSLNAVPLLNAPAAGGPLRNRSHKTSRLLISSPYPHNSQKSGGTSWELNKRINSMKIDRMKEETLVSHSLEIHHHHGGEGGNENETGNGFPQFNFLPPQPHQGEHQHHQYLQCGGFGGLLETLPEASSEEESLPSIHDEVVEMEDAIKDGGEGTPKQLPPLPEENNVFSTSNSRIPLLESIIKQLKDELKESKDQNELLEFRLLEIQELNPIPNNNRNNVPQNNEALNTEKEVKDVIHGLSLEEVENVDFPEIAPNPHATITESRSSCSSDCSETLSLQESGIFDGQSSEDGGSSVAGGFSPGRNPAIKSELSNLTFQIETLLRRYDEEQKDKSPSPLREGEETSSKLKKAGRAVAKDSDLSYCRQRIEEFEKRLHQLNDISYTRSLEEKVNNLLMENKRIEEERTEIEEAENDNRYMCQRLEDTVCQLRKKKSLLQNRLSEEKSLVSQLREEILQLQSNTLCLRSKVTKLESLLQNYEDRNFELEEISIELKCSLQYVIHSMPLISICMLWREWQPMNLFELVMNPKKSKAYFLMGYIGINRSLQGTPTNTATTTTILRRKHKLPSSPPPLPKKPKNIPPRNKTAQFLIHSPTHEIMELEQISSITSPHFNSLESSSSQSSLSPPLPLSSPPSSSLKMDFPTNFVPPEYTHEEFIVPCDSNQKPPISSIKSSLESKIESLELDIDRLSNAFSTERAKLIQECENRLLDKQNQLENLERERITLGSKYTNLIQQLDESFNLSEFSEYPEGIENVLLTLKNKVTSIQEENSRLHLKLQNDIDTADEKLAGELNLLKECRRKVELELESKNQELQNAIQEGVKLRGEHVERFEALQEENRKLSLQLQDQESLLSSLRQLQDEGEKLRIELQYVHETEERLKGEQGSLHLKLEYLLEENQRLSGLLKDHDKLWGDLHSAQEEGERLRGELQAQESVGHKLEESMRIQGELRFRLEEFERSEMNFSQLRIQMSKNKARQGEKIQQLRDELQFLRNKCCQLQDDLDARVQKEGKYKSEAVQMAGKVKELESELEDKEAMLERNIKESNSKVNELKRELEDVYQNFTDTECSNGMLREEISYLEKTFEDAALKNAKNEGTIAALSCELKEKDSVIESLEVQLRSLQLNQGQKDPNQNELEDFNTTEGGLHGIVRAVKEVVTFVKRCGECQLVSGKLMEIVDKLIPLIQILKSSHLHDLHYYESNDMVESMTRCESDELLIPSKINENEENLREKAQQSMDEEDEILISRLQSTLGQLTQQMTKLEENLNIRQLEMRESHLTEMRLWKSRCDEKNLLIQLLALRLAHLSISDVEGHFLNAICTQIKNFSLKRNGSCSSRTPDFSFSSLPSFLISQRRIIMELFENDMSPVSEDNRVDFRVVRRIGEDALLVSWTMPKGLAQNLGGYEIAVNGATYLRIPKPDRYKAVLFGLNLDEPLQLTFKCATGINPSSTILNESTITFIS